MQSAKLNCYIIFIKGARAKLFISFESFIIAPLETDLATILKSYFTKKDDFNIFENTF
jgi:hypothetical protein